MINRWRRPNRELGPRMFVAPYKLGSESAKVLAQALNVKRVKGDKIFKPTDVIVNWGNSNLSPRGNPKIINNPTAVGNASNKIRSFQLFDQHGVATLDWTTDKNKAMRWIDEGFTVYGRSKVSAHSGEGIVLMSDDNGKWQECPLYTKGILKAHEYRVHVCNGKVIDLQKKRRRTEQECSEFVKNVANGWVFCRDNVKAPMNVFTESIKAIEALGLVFGAVDILYKEKDKTVAVLEINSSPGLEGTTLQKYKEALWNLKPNTNT